MTITQLAPGFSVGGQISPEDVASLAAQGFTDIVCNRPDAEALGGPVSDMIATAASAHGIRFHYAPIAHFENPAPQVRKMAQVMAQPGARIFAYCRSGARSASAWSMASVDNTAA